MVKLIKYLVMADDFNDSDCSCIWGFVRCSRSANKVQKSYFQVFVFKIFYKLGILYKERIDCFFSNLAKL